LHTDHFVTKTLKGEELIEERRVREKQLVPGGGGRRVLLLGTRKGGMMNAIKQISGDSKEEWGTVGARIRVGSVLRGSERLAACSKKGKGRGG